MSSPTADPALRFAGPLPPGLTAEDLERRRRRLAEWRRRSALIRALRRILPAAALALLLALAGMAAVNTIVRRLGQTRQDKPPAIRMLNPHFQGRNDAGKPYVITAAAAVRDDVDPQLVTLEGPVFTLSPGTDDQTVVRSRHGLYREDTKILDLRGDVHLDNHEGNHFITEHAYVDTVKSNVDGDEPVRGHGPLGRIASSAYAVRDGGAHVFFNGRVRSHIEHQSDFVAAPSAPRPAAAAK